MKQKIKEQSAEEPIEEAVIEIPEIKEDKRSWRQREQDEREKDALAKWKPKTKIGILVKDGKIKDIDKILEENKILEPEIIDFLLNTKSELLNIGQSKGKFGGGKRRAWKQTQKKTAEGNVPTFSCMAVIGDGAGYIGVGIGKAKETVPAREKALRKAKLNLMKVIRGCGSFDCSCNELHSIPFKTEGKCGSSRVILYPAPQGTGLVIGDECKKILKLAGIKDIYSKSFGQTRSTINFARACLAALSKIKEKNR